MTRLIAVILVSLTSLLLWSSSPVLAAAAHDDASSAPVTEVTTFNLAADQAATMTETAVTTEEKTATGGGNWDIWGPVQMRCADPEDLGELELKNKISYGTSSDGTDDDVEYEIELEWGFAPDHELIFEVPVEMGDGGVDGNADITLGWHWRLWKEQDWIPAFAIRNYLRVPSGYHSSGVDWEFRGLLTKSIVPDKWRLHLNPFFKSANGDNIEDVRYFQWGFIFGTDYKITDNLVFNMDYVHETSDEEGYRNQHSMEVGLDWNIDEHSGIGFVSRNTLDGDGFGENWGFTITYKYVFDNIPALGK